MTERRITSNGLGTHHAWMVDQTKILINFTIQQLNRGLMVCGKHHPQQHLL